jgi:hypothetical protein
LFSSIRKFQEIWPSAALKLLMLFSEKSLEEKSEFAGLGLL